MSTTQAQAGSFAEGPPPDLCGRTLDGFRVLRKLGQGGMGEVYLAEQVSLKRNVALKILRTETSADLKARALARFRREAEAVAQATHANIVQVYAYGEADGMPYMALEYVEGRNLRDYLLKKGPPELAVALSIMRQVASALQRASELGLVHRDVKPDNILLTRKAEAKVADFGLSCWLEGQRPELNLTATGVTMGTPLYMSPEQVEGKVVDPRTDVYSFGVTCYHMLAGQPPFRGESAFEVALQHVQREPEPLARVRPDLPPLLCEVVHKMMAKSPDQRYQTCRDLLRDLARVRDGRGPAAPPTLPLDGSARLTPGAGEDAPPTQEGVPVRRPHRLWPWLAVAFVGSLLLAAGLGAAGARKARHRAGPPPGASRGPADASVVETIHLPSQREQALRLLVDQALSVPKGKAPDAGAFSVCMDLGLFYLEEGRLGEAESHFGRLAACKDPPSFQMLGQTGVAVALALRNQAAESNALFARVFTQPKGPFAGRARKAPNAAALLSLEHGPLAPILPLLSSPRGRDWLAQARWANFKNGVKEEAVPRYLAWSFPLGDAGGKK